MKKKSRTAIDSNHAKLCIIEVIARYFYGRPVPVGREASTISRLHPCLVTVRMEDSRITCDRLLVKKNVVHQRRRACNEAWNWLGNRFLLLLLRGMQRSFLYIFYIFWQYRYFLLMDFLTEVYVVVQWTLEDPLPEAFEIRLQDFITWLNWRSNNLDWT